MELNCTYRRGRSAAPWRCRTRGPRDPPWHTRRIARIQADHGWQVPPACSIAWSDRLLQRWFAEGGVITTAAAEEEENDATYRSLLDLIGVGLPVCELLPVLVGSRGLLGAAFAGDTPVFARIAEQLARDGVVLVDIGIPSDHAVWQILGTEGRKLWPHMQAGYLESRDGKLTRGKSPSGAERGDRCIHVSEARQLHATRSLCALNLLDLAMGVVGDALAPAMGDHPLLRQHIRLRTDPKLACFPGGAAKYGAHYDGGQLGDACKMTSILYCNQG